MIADKNMTTYVRESSNKQLPIMHNKRVIVHKKLGKQWRKNRAGLNRILERSIHPPKIQIFRICSIGYFYITMKAFANIGMSFQWPYSRKPIFGESCQNHIVQEKKGLYIFFTSKEAGPKTIMYVHGSVQFLFNLRW
jgi:hypothetical protein